MIDLTIVNRSGKRVPQKFLRAWVSHIASLQPKARGELVIAFVTRKEIRHLNRTFRGKDYATDVLSFEGEAGAGVAGSLGSAAELGAARSLGELAISPEVIAKQAREHGLLEREELGYMVLHGILHLMGYDHETNERDAKRMFTLQDALFAKLLKRNASAKPAARGR